MANPKYKVSDKPVPVSELVDTLSDGTKVKRRVPRMRACNEKDEKGRVILRHANDLKAETGEVREGMRVIVWMEETEMEGVLEFESELWRARLDPTTLRHR